MNEDEILEAYFQICKRTYEQMERDGTWPWAEGESPNPQDMVESDDNPKNI